MRDLLERGSTLTEIFVPSPFQVLVGGGFNEVQGCVFLRRFFGYDTLMALPPDDPTGNECSVNSFHLEDYLEKGMAREAPALAATATKCADWLAERLRRFSAEPFRIISSIEDRHCTMRFHKRRDGETWLADDIEAYEEAIAVLDIA
jgi:hypothetical protein